MGIVYFAWAVVAAVLLAYAGWLGVQSKGKVLGMIIDNRGRMSLSRFQIALWSVLVISLIAGVWFGRWVDGVDSPADFEIPSELLLLMGISLGSGVAASAIKNEKDKDAGRGVVLNIAAEPRVSQMFQADEGGDPTEVDITKFQNLAITVILVAAYLAAVFALFSDLGDPADIDALPLLDGSFATLLAISHAAYLGGKLPNRQVRPNPGMGAAAPPAPPTPAAHPAPAPTPTPAPPPARPTPPAEQGPLPADTPAYAPEPPPVDEGG